MGWDVAFTIVGLVWAAVVLFCFKSSESKENAHRIYELEKQYTNLRGTVNWLERHEETRIRNPQPKDVKG